MIPQRVFKRYGKPIELSDGSIIYDRTFYTPKGELNKPGNTMKQPHFIQSGLVGASLDICSQTATWKTGGNAKKRKAGRIFSAALNGIKRCFNLGRDAYFLTLTSAPNSKDIGKHFDLFVKRIRRELNYEFQFLKVQTNEGNGVIHLLYHSAFDGIQVAESTDGLNFIQTKDTLAAIHAYLSCLWSELHGGSFIVWNTLIQRSQMKKIAGYMCQYVASQKGFIRKSQSKNWIFSGWRKEFLRFIKEYGFKLGIQYFENLLANEKISLLQPSHIL